MKWEQAKRVAEQVAWCEARGLDPRRIPESSPIEYGYDRERRRTVTVQYAVFDESGAAKHRHGRLLTVPHTVLDVDETASDPTRYLPDEDPRRVEVIESTRDVLGAVELPAPAFYNINGRPRWLEAELRAYADARATQAAREARADERARVVAWLQAGDQEREYPDVLAGCIERGEHA